MADHAEERLQSARCVDDENLRVGGDAVGRGDPARDEHHTAWRQLVATVADPVDGAAAQQQDDLVVLVVRIDE